MHEQTKILIQSLTSFTERQLTEETAARKLIESTLASGGIDFSVQEYRTYIPQYTAWGLKVDGQEMPALPCGLHSGEIKSKSTILSSLISSQHNLYDANINFNPQCDVISRSNFYFAPALAINRLDVQKVINAEKVEGYLEVEKVEHQSANILVGNRHNPKVIVFSHYDSISTGTIDNASGTALSLDLVLEHPELQGEVLFAFCGNEELSYDEPIYWGHGYREFEAGYATQLENAKRIIVVDSLGHSPLETITDVSIMKLAFPITAIEALSHKTEVLAGNFAQLMAFYHAENDTRDKLSDEYCQQSYEQVLQKLKVEIGL